MKFACNYAIARFLPYAETDEFVNVGIALMCPETAFFDFLLADANRRVTEFFSQLDPSIYGAGLEYFREELASLRDSLKKKELRVAGGGFEREYALGVLRELVKPRESIFRFGPARTVLAEDPAACLKNLYTAYIERDTLSKSIARA